MHTLRVSYTVTTVHQVIIQGNDHRDALEKAFDMAHSKGNIAKLGDTHTEVSDIAIEDYPTGLSEVKAFNVGSDRRMLLRVLKQALSRSPKELSEKDYIFDEDRKCLISEDGTVKVQWRLRPNPYRIPNKENPQTQEGYCEVILLPKELTE